MQRRKYLIGIGSLAAGSAAALGTGAFTSVTAERAVDIQVAGDADAFLALDRTSHPNSQDYIHKNGDQITLALDETKGGGSGFNEDADTRIDDVLRVTNQGTQTINFWVTFSGGTDFDNDNLYFYPAGDTEDKLNDGEGGDTVLGLTPGESAKIGVYVDTDGLTKDTSDEELTATFHANVKQGASDESQPVDQDGDDFVVVAKDGGDYSSIQEAIDNVDGTTIAVRPGTYDESITIDVEGLTLKGADGASPTIAPGDDADAITVTANNVTVDGLSIEIVVTDGDATAIDLSGLGSDDSVTLENNDFDAGGEEGETYVFDPNGAVDLDAVEGANSFTGPAPVTGEVAINPNQPDAFDFENADGEDRITRGGAAVEKTDGTLEILEPNKDYDDTLAQYDADATLLYVSNESGSVTLGATAYEPVEDDNDKA
ncbi:MAG: hypothetical protein ACOCR6_03135, partial [archaeon]